MCEPRQIRSAACGARTHLSCPEVGFASKSAALQGSILKPGLLAAISCSSSNPSFQAEYPARMRQFTCRLLPLLCVLLMGFLAAPAAMALRIAAAADLEPVLPPLLKSFNQKTGIRAEVAYASSATLASQILNGAPFDLFLSADFSFAQRVIAGGYAVESKPVPYAKGTLVLWTRKDAGVLRGGKPLSIEMLRSPGLGKVAIANPAHAPYGRAAVAAIHHLGLASTLQPRLVIAENIAQAAQFVESGNAEVGFLSLTSAVTPLLEKTGTFVRLPSGSYPPILQGAVVVRNSAGRQQAQRFLDFLRLRSTRDQLRALGLDTP